MTTADQTDRITRGTAAAHATAAYDGMLALLESLDADEWRLPTECEGWTVADMVGHVIGAAKAGASLREQLRQQRRARRCRHEHDGNTLDAVNALQVAEHRELTPSERIAVLREIGPAAVRGRMRFPSLLRRVRIPLDRGGSTAAGMPDRLGLGHLMDVVYTRDVWLHRIDIARATGRDAGVTVADGPIVADIVSEWAERHGAGFELVLTGPAGRKFRQGRGDVRLEMDAVEFCRVLSGRAAGDGLLGVRVVF